MSEIKTRPTLLRRAAGSADEPWLKRLFAQLRGLDAAMIEACPALLDQQWQLQQRIFASDYPGARTELILLDGEPIGVLTLEEREDSLRIVEIGLEAHQRGRGVGEQLLLEVIAQADHQSKPLELAVMRHNPAVRLYLRLGFERLAGAPDEAQWQMRREPVHPA
ncbi:GNAT family N-acetyltransferase [Pseudomonas sp. PDM33]|uniref:GNAT family N-acetyltransferase n=1 Tax=unclassified Pseudomonas TaxID=196821 RepID=UPI00069ACEA0|nr:MULTISPECIES: GNAT family N-acetyltransferase [unclassified Pseudomonas]MBV7585310.1 GNAT family N-acetyltransferase [Pseudomonas sp. PDM33]